MTDKQRRFADEYLIDLNATRAYMTAYPAIKRLHTAESNGSRLLRNAEVCMLRIVKVFALEDANKC